MQQLSAWQRAAAGFTVAALMVGATVAIAQISEENLQDRLIQIAPSEGSEQLQIQPFSGEDRLVEVPKHWIGLMVGPLPDLVRKHLKLEEGQGVLVLSVVEDSPAAKSGISRDDIVVSAGNKDLSQSRDLIEIVREHGDSAIELQVIHEGERNTVTITPAERPAEYSVIPFQQSPDAADWQILPGDMPDVRKWLEKLPEAGDLPLKFRAVGPGMFFNEGRLDLESLPDGMSIQIQKQGDQPAHVKVQQGDQTWEFDADNKDALEQLPEDVQSAVKAMLGGRGNRLSLRFNEDGDFLRRSDGPRDRLRVFNGEEMEKRMEEMEARMSELFDQIERLTSEE